ncbi:MAG TPA: alpha/beta hydrolase-fold protein [Anaerolineaceae bacterium]|nr:alpha/beta hydrolase-fold protein [Anaerolineaceae bacterium]HPN50452.1 alpha/beta hydrolase-fold protein [Anaerolineaceae bacterium]
MKRFLWLSFAVILCLMLAACQDSEALLTGAATSGPAAAPSFTPAPLPTRTAEPAATSTLTPAPTARPSLTPQPICTATLTATPTPPPCAENGRLETFEIASVLFKTPLRGLVYLPPCYDASPAQSYPVLYLIHAMNRDENQWVELGLPEAADRLMQSGIVRPYLIVMPYDPSGWKQPAEMPFDLALVNDVIPYIDGRYHTQTDRAHRAVGGLSRGGGWAIHIGLLRWGLFSAMGAHSPGIFRDDAEHLKKWLERIPADSLPRIWVDIGESDHELLPSVLDFEALLTDKAVPHEWRLSPGYHDDRYWRKELETYLRWYGAEW